MDILRQIFSPEPPKEEEKQQHIGGEKQKPTGGKKEEKQQPTGGGKKKQKHAPPAPPPPPPVHKRPTETHVMPIEVSVEKEVICEPAVVTEQIKQLYIEKEQPVIHRQVEQTEVRQVLQPLIEKDVKAATLTIQEKEINLGIREEEAKPIALEGRSLGKAPKIVPTVESIGTEYEKQSLPPIIEETVHKKIVEQIQPIVQKETIIPHITETTKHIHETVKEKPVITHEVRPPISGKQWKEQESSICQPHPQEPHPEQPHKEKPHKEKPHKEKPQPEQAHHEKQHPEQKAQPEQAHHEKLPHEQPHHKQQHPQQQH